MYALRRGVYEAARASALAGVPLSTLYEWARQEVVIPSVSPEKVKLWSWSDLVAARAVYWLRHPRDGRKPTPMRQVRGLIERIEAEEVTLGQALTSHSVALSVDPSGTPHVETEGMLTEALAEWRQRVSGDVIQDILHPFSIEDGIVGPHLLTPAQGISIVPGKLSGEPHVHDTRIETRVLSAMWDRGFRLEQLGKLYPDADEASIRRAIRLERQLQRNQSRLAA